MGAIHVNVELHVGEIHVNVLYNFTWERFTSMYCRTSRGSDSRICIVELHMGAIHVNVELHVGAIHVNVF